MFSKHKKQILTIIIAGGAVFLATGIFLLLFGKVENLPYTINQPRDFRQPLRVSAAGADISFLPVGAKAASKQKAGEDIVQYEDAYPQTDVVQTRDNFFFKEELILKQPGHPQKFSYELDLTNLQIEKNSQGGFDLRLLEKPEHILFSIPKPFMIDAEENLSYAVSMEISDNRLIIQPDENWLKNAQYPVRLDPSLEIRILNIHSHPQKGDDWTVEFTTQGRADLTITPADQATVVDDVFTGLYCGDEQRQPQILDNDVIFYPDWQCGETAKVVHYTQTAGNHHLIFDFGGQQAEAFNSAWWDTDWTKRRKITFDTTTTASTTALTDFPAAVLLDSSRVDYSVTQNLGQDIRFIDADSSTELNYEIETWNESGTSTVWVKVPSIAAASSTDHIWMYYGNAAAADNSTTTGVWDSDYVMVQHMNEIGGDFLDSTANSIDSNYIDGVQQRNAPGILGGAAAGDNLRISAPNHTLLDDNSGLTVEIWMKYESVSDDVIIRKLHSTSPWDAYKLDVVSSKFQLAVRPAAGGSAIYADDSTTIATGTWYHIVGTYDDTNTIIYVNSQIGEIENGGDGVYDSDSDLQFPGYAYPDATMDEVRISKNARSMGWIEFEYCNMSDDCTTYGSEEEPSGGSGSSTPAISSVTDSPDPVAVGSDITFSVDWADADSGETVKIHICRTNSLTGTSCSVPNWCSSASFTASDPATCSYTASSSDQTTSSISVQVGADSDDAEECTTDGGMDNGSSDLELVVDGGCTQEVGMRWDNITIPQGSLITNAYIEFQTDETSSGTTNLTFWGEDTDNASGFIEVDYNISSRATTTASVDWNNVPAWNSVGEKHITPDITDVIQEIVNRSGWQSGNALAVIVTGSGTRTAEAHDGSYAPRLYVEYISRPYYAFVCDDDNNCSSAAFGSFSVMDAPPNSAPTISSVNDTPDPQSQGSDITFSVDWNDTDGEGVKMLICKTNAITTSGPFCTGGEWTSNADDYEMTDPITATYPATAPDIGTNNYYAFVCDDQPTCSAGSSGSFTVSAYSPANIINIKGNTNIKGGVKVK